jgi:DNA-binding IclR family transcriptional regulator
MSRGQRSDQDYANESLLRGLKVLAALEGTNFEPVSIRRVAERAQLPYDFCRRALLTMKVAGFAAETSQGWQAGPKLLRFSTRFNELCLATIHAQDSEISESKK